jgi:hypothetical protein
MHGLSAAEQLNVWEQGQKQTFHQRALLLLAASCSDISISELVQLSIGQRDRYLLALQELTFGQQLACLVKCPECKEQLDLAFKTTEILAGNYDLGREITELAEIQSLNVENYKVDFRLPNSLDMIELENIQDKRLPRQRLLERCFLMTVHNEEQVSFDQLPPNVIEAVTERMAQVDSQSDVQLSLVCPACAHQWLATFDIVSFLWNEISMMAQRILYEVHVLAKAYGWSETEILTMSPFRRQCYLEMAGI